MPVKRAALFIRMNDLVINDAYVLPVVYRPRTSAAGTRSSRPSRTTVAVGACPVGETDPVSPRMALSSGRQ